MEWPSSTQLQSARTRGFQFSDQRKQPTHPRPRPQKLLASLTFPPLKCTAPSMKVHRRKINIFYLQTMVITFNGNGTSFFKCTFCGSWAAVRCVRSSNGAKHTQNFRRRSANKTDPKWRATSWRLKAEGRLARGVVWEGVKGVVAGAGTLAALRKSLVILNAWTAWMLAQNKYYFKESISI